MVCFRLNVILVLFCSIFIVVSSIISNELRVTLSNESRLIGRYIRSHNGSPIRAFTGIPYAKPPIGPLRFKAPEPLPKWNGEYSATNDGPMCIQVDVITRSNTVMGDEDYLYLNVYAPHTFVESKSNLPVMVYIHGGGAVSGTAIRSVIDPGYLLDHDVIFVSLNYRLGALGFLSTEDANCPGNFALKDIVLGLKWIQQNINRFGGDPDSVTIFGGSAGSAIVTYMMMSPLAEGLFSKAIASSGVNVSPLAQPAHEGVAIKRATELAKTFDCYAPKSWSKTINCLREVPAQNITAAIFEFFEYDIDPLVIFAPVVEPDLPGAFITKHPRDGQDENSLKIPFLTGTNFDEGLLKSAALFHHAHMMDDFLENIDFALPFMCNYYHHELSVQETFTKQIKDFYFDGIVTRDKETNITNLFSDWAFLAPMHHYLHQRLAHKNAAPTYVYLLTHQASVSLSTAFLGDPEKLYGISHGDEMLYLFPLREKISPSSLPTKEDEQIRQTILRIFVDFARSGNPTPPSSPLPVWNEARGFPLEYYRIGNTNFEGKPIIGMEKGGLFDDRAQFWLQLGANLPANYTQKDEL